MSLAAAVALAYPVGIVPRYWADVIAVVLVVASLDDDHHHSVAVDSCFDWISRQCSPFCCRREIKRVVNNVMCIL